MTRLLLGTAAAFALATTAMAADLPRQAPPVAKAPLAPAPPRVAVYNWTGCYVAGGGGYGMWNQDTSSLNEGVPVSSEVNTGGRGWFGTVGGGCDVQVDRWVIGAFGDYDFANIKGDLTVPLTVYNGEEKERSAWAVGGRIGYLITPAVLTYFTGGYTEARFSAVDLTTLTLPPVPTGLSVPAHTYSGWFLGSGYEYNLGWVPGLSWRTEYRLAQYDRDNLPVVITATGAPTGLSIDNEKFVQTIRSELVWRWNFGR